MDSKVSSPGHGQTEQGRSGDTKDRYSAGTTTKRRDRGGRPRGWRSFLTPGWALSVLFILIFSYAAFSLLAPWQLNKDGDIVARNEQIKAGFDREVVPYAEVFDSNGEVAPEDEWYRVSLTGQYLPQNEVLLRLRPVEESPAFQSLTPFRLDDGRTVLINRGFEASQGTIVPEIAAAPDTPVTIVGFARKNERLPGSAPLRDSGYEQVYGISTEQISEVTGLDLGTDYIQLAEGEPGALRAMPIPQLDRGSHLSYGFQWIAFGIMAPLGLGYFIWAEMRERRRDRAERAQMAGVEQGSTAGPDPDPGSDRDAPAAVGASLNETSARGAADTASGAAAALRPGSSGDGGTPVTASARRRRSRYGDQHPNHYEQLSKRDEQRF